MKNKGKLRSILTKEKITENNKNKEKILFSELLNKWINENENFIKISTFSTYTTLIETHIKISFEGKYANDITNEDLQKFILEKLKNGRIIRNSKSDVDIANVQNKSLSVKTVKDMLTIIKACLNYGMKNELIEIKNLDYKIPKFIIFGKEQYQSQNNVQVFGEKELSKILKYIFKNLNTKTIGILLALNTGIRIGELCALKWENINFEKKILTVSSTLQRVYDKRSTKKTKIITTTPKTKKSNRILPLDKDIIELLKKYKTEDKNYILSNTEKCIEPKRIRNYYYKILKEVEVKKLKFHCLRHTYATKAIEIGINYKIVSEILGHSSINTTLELYVHPQLEEKKKCSKMIFEEFKKIEKK